MANENRDGLVGTLGVYALIVVVCAVVAGGVGALWYVLPSRRRYHRTSARMEAIRKDTTAAMKSRFWVGAGIGAVIGVGASVVLHQKMRGR